MTGAIYNFNDPREFLSEVLKEKQRVNPRFSLRSWSKQLGFSSPSVLSMILRGERKIQLDLVSRISDSLRLPKEEQNYLQVLALYSNASSPTEKQLYLDLLKQLRPDKEFSNLTLDRFRIIADWYHFAIYEMVDLKDFRNDPEAISARLGGQITPVQAKQAVERLLRLELLVVDSEGRLSKGDPDQVFTTTDVPSDALKKHHSQMIEKAALALRSQTVHEREISSNTIAIQLSKLPEAKKAIRKFQKSIAALCTRKPCDEVYQLNIQFFRITEGPTK